MNTKITSMKRAFVLIWHGLTALLAGIANWFTVILGKHSILGIPPF